MRNQLFVLWVLLGLIPSATAQVSVEINLPGADIGFYQPVYPDLVAVPGYPVYYAPQVNSNYFFYDGMYWVYQRDNWYASSWYNGPWGLVSPEGVPLFILRIPVRYYRQPPGYFQGWSSDAAPHWGEHWGSTWDQRRRGWDSWDRAAVPAPAPLPVYQRQYSGDRYPPVEQQQALQTQNYRYQPREVVVQQHAQAPRAQAAPAAVPQPKQAAPQARNTPPQTQRGAIPAAAPEQATAATRRAQPPQPPGADAQRSAAAKVPPQQGNPAAQPQQQQSKQAVAQGQPQAPRAQGQNKAPAPEAKAAHGTQPAQQPVAQHQAPQAPQGVAPHQAQQPPQGVAQHQEPAPKAQERAPQGKAPAQEPKPGQEKG
jgi:hypothetical protein